MCDKISYVCCEQKIYDTTIDKKDTEYYRETTYMLEQINDY
jgi:hypothetical protein